MNDRVIDNDTGNDVLDPRKALSEQTLAVDLARGEIDMQIATAHKYPRILDSVVKQLETLACYNDESAENCIYSLPRGGKPIIGPSIGFANILATVWGNCIDAGTPTYIDRKEKLVYAQGTFHDLQTNRRIVIQEQRRISGKGGSIYSDDMIAITGKAAASVARRNAILNAVPRAIWHPVYEKALQIVRGDVETFAERKEKAMKAFHQFGVKPEQVYMVLGLKGDVDLTLEHIPALRGMYSALKEGSVTVEEMFDPRRQVGKGFETVADPLSGDETAVADETAGMGEDLAQEAHQGKPQAETTVAPAQAQAQDTQTAKAATPGPQDAKPTQAAQETTKAKPAEVAETKPTSAAEYLVYWKDFCTAATSHSAITSRFAADRELRKKLAPFSEDQFTEMNGIKDERIAALKK